MTSCLFCRIATGDEPAHVVAQTADTVAFLDTRPVFKGHTLIVPRQHVPTLDELPDPLLPAFLAEMRRMSRAIRAGLDAQGTFVAINNVVSQSVPHLHAHVVPRTKGDGLRGFFWPRTTYVDDAEAQDYAARIAAALQPG